MTATERLKERFAKLQTEGLRDMKVSIQRPLPEEVTVDDLAGELNAILDAYERKDFVTTPEQMAKFL